MESAVKLAMASSIAGSAPGIFEAGVANRSTNPRIIVNMRSMSAGLSGVQRYVNEVSARLGDKLERIAPVRPLQGIKGHLWEQCWLSGKISSRLLWSPANTGPLLCEQQVLTVHDLAAIDHPEWFAAKFSAWYRFLLPRLVRSVRRVVAVSEFTKQRLVEIAGVDPMKITVILNGVDQRFRPCAATAINGLRMRLKIPSERYVLSLGTVEPRKNLPVQLDAWSRCVERLPADTWLVIAGRVGQRHVFSNVNIERVPPRIHFTGFVPDADLPTLYSGALALLYPSIYEGFGLPALESMASGTVPIVSNSTALPEVVADCGLTVDPSDGDAIAAAITSLVRSPLMHRDMRERAIRRAQSFTWEKTAAMTWEVLCQASAQ
jgi:glycosyltransferase involved in cell wall biosynthesis